ncbi:srpA-related protein [Pseudoalteromonas sp. SW0106-04]|uniref:putative metalloprotease CJM1_0395 family protein n=1 Tax=Pseudoalteromonas sp. SW0106-04 TaxID=1702169 RepID=UPI0006B4B86D|nr:putative metalloprotease CJM1_0395 family protein [Pseudoalteromonas sp. SW0106-04]GAP74399.1 srpA-related protein [Pseudoalteromonas sp. SW0106-04]
MNIVTPTPTINFNTANVYTESVRRDNQLREVIPEPKQPAQSATDNKAASDADKARNPGQSKDAQSSEKETVAQQKTINERDSEGAEEQSSEQQQQQREQEQQQIQELAERDREVRTHEQAHASVGGQYAGSPSYDYQRGPDGKNYAVGGEVQIDVGEVPGDPQATIEKMQQVRSAALAPAEPSGADRAIANEATQKLARAQAELAGQQLNTSEEEETPIPPAFATNEPTRRFERDQEVESRALRIADFYQQVSAPQERKQSAFMAQV